MSMDYIRRTYGVPARRGARIAFDYPPKHGAVVSARGACLRVRFDGEQVVRTLHPTWMVAYLKTPNAAGKAPAR